MEKEGVLKEGGGMQAGRKDVSFLERDVTWLKAAEDCAKGTPRGR